MMQITIYKWNILTMFYKAARPFRRKAVTDTSDNFEKENLTEIYRNKIETHNTKTKLNSQTIQAQAMVWLNYLNESILLKSLEQWSAASFNTLSNEYTKIIDGSFAEGMKSGTDYVSPSLHRIIESGHTLPQAFDLSKDALDNDTVIQEIWGTSTALLSDMSSVIGLPINNISHISVNEWLDKLSPFGINEKKFADLLSYNTVELIGSIIPILALMFSWNSADTRKFTQIVGILGISALYAGNPISLIVVMVGLARSFQKARNSNVKMKDWLKALSHGGIISMLVLLLMSVIGATLWTMIICALVIIKLLQSKDIPFDPRKLAKYILALIRQPIKSC